ncbi:hypothetical protein LTR47_010315 [Exophiala xenobiotica]|nr:hypothetical protein LTR92_002758 [Exophiala xenobiotica]KAK5223234.1 hypothetical protein LTR47_010315 [Exophiala xenobiotica]KAK5227930.1 hypothetical protein LTR72_001813 [Exophiala xenobiotica]KAK5249760.1 hypothetical protein LTS06_005395 [Exophiala xenobiotica]KAK5285558.1 hypothetical protein LTR14_010832 [Exophiala xenobiotica]
MFGWDDAQNAHQEVYGSGGYDNQAKFSHEVIAGGAAFEGMKLFEDRQRQEGKPVSHKFAKELLAGFVGGEVDKLAETKGMDEYDTYEAKKKAKSHAEQMYDQHYDGMDQYDPNQRDSPNFNY